MPAQCAHVSLIRKYLPELAVALTLQDATVVADSVVGQGRGLRDNMLEP